MITLFEIDQFNGKRQWFMKHNDNDEEQQSRAISHAISTETEYPEDRLMW
jgi:hypothetical protein